MLLNNLNNYSMIKEEFINKLKTIFRSIGFYDSIKTFLSKFMKQKRNIINVSLSLPVLGILAYILLYSCSTNQLDSGLWIVFFLLAINLVFFVHLIWWKKDDFQERTYNAYFTLMLFNVSIFPLFNFIEDYHERNKVEVNYTAGFRAWGSVIKYSDIKVSYYDKYGNPFSLSSSDINNTLNWESEVWIEDSKKLGMKYSTIFTKDSSGIVLKLENCGALLSPKLFEDHKATSFYIEAKVELIRIDPFYLNKPDSLKYYNSQFCLRVPYIRKDKKFTDIYYGFELSYMNFPTSKLRIPGLNFDYTFAELDYKNKYFKESTNSDRVIKTINKAILKFKGDSIKPINLGFPLDISAVLFNDDAAFYIYNNKDGYTLPLFNFNISSYGKVNLLGN